ncbi:pectin lyase-like superfamily protein [Striga asiatica]|uniref:Pectin lyase-like superfamily protein n=1 Tax=Striga asiatica TaxID=4170 RepID=A0A5A7QUM3_STRAF|nr:pectin lyase-like superfamily protein [Striga asiatica]
MYPCRYFLLFLAIPLCFSGRLVQCRPFEHLEKTSDYRVSSYISASPSPSPENYNPPQISSLISVFNVLSYGALGDGLSDDTLAFKTAWDLACRANVPAVFLVPGHYTFLIQSTIFTGPCGNGLVFQIEGSLIPPDGPDSWSKIYNKRQWLVFYRVNGMTMQGGGVIDGKGEKWWNLPCKPHRGVNGTTVSGPCDSPVAIRFYGSSNLTVQGLKIRNSPQFHFRFDYCNSVRIDSLSIKSPATSPNTDGIHIENSNDVKIYNSIVANGDDCVSIGAGSYNVDIRNITCGPSHGISIGSLGMKNSRACVSNITVSDSVITQSDNGVRIKTWQGGFGSVSRVAFANIRMDKVRNPIIIDQYYCDSKGKCPNQTSAVYVSGVSYTSIKGTYDPRGPPVRFTCSDTVPCTNLTLRAVELSPAAGKVGRWGAPFCWNAYGDDGKALCLAEGLPELLPVSDADKC